MLTYRQHDDLRLLNDDALRVRLFGDLRWCSLPVHLYWYRNFYDDEPRLTYRSNVSLTLYERGYLEIVDPVHQVVTSSTTRILPDKRRVTVPSILTISRS